MQMKMVFTDDDRQYVPDKKFNVTLSDNELWT